MSIPKGGRGKKAPYKTVQVRCPEPVKPVVEKIIDQFRSGEENLNTGKPLSSMSNDELWNLMSGLSKECSKRFPRTTAQQAEELVDQIMAEMEAAGLDHNAQLRVVTRLTETFLG